jgi:pimeloyl-ACP methyl ester carboxylesterase
MLTPLDDWRRAGAEHTWRGHNIFHITAGSGPPLLLIHGFPTSSHDWSAIWPGLAAHHRLLALDMIGFGFSAKPRDFAYSIAAQADLFEAFLAREGVTSCAILAHDYGLTVAQELLARQLDGTAAARFTAACLLNGGLFPETHRPRLVQRLLASPLGPLIARVSSYRSFARTMRRIGGTHPPADAELRAMYTLLETNDGRAVLPRLISYMAERRRHRARWVGAIASATIPIRVIDGLADPISGANMVARYRELIPHPDVVELPGVGHYPQVEAPDAVLAATREFLSA